MRVLVAYGSTRGGTAGLAHLVADAFIRHQIRCEVRRAGDVRDLGDYDAVIVGGALYNNRWHPEATTFVGRHRRALRGLPVWFFSSGPLDDSARSGALAPVAQVNTLAREVEIRGHMTFGGLLDKRPSGLLGMFAWGEVGDFRDRRHVAEWVERVAEDLQGEHESMVRVFDSGGRQLRQPTLQQPGIVPAKREPVNAEPADSGFADDDLVALRSDVRIEWADDTPQRSANGGLSRIRQYLTLDDEADDDGLDLLHELAEP